jgi:hypothetical protein
MTGSQIHQAPEQRFGLSRKSGRRMSSDRTLLTLIEIATGVRGGSGGGGSHV